jgi:hypothetical protein
MECNEFHLWLRTRVRNTPQSPGAREHRLGCPDCQQLYDLDTQAEKQIALAFATRELPRELAARIDHHLEMAPSFSNRFLPKPGRLKLMTPLKTTGWVAGIMVLVMILAGVFSLQPASFESLEQISEQAVMDHLKGNQKISFDATTLFQALEMFRKELGFNVLLPDLVAQGCFLVGGRICALGNCRAAYFLIEKQGKKGSLFIMAVDHLDFEIADGTQFLTTIKGCDTHIWKDNDQVYATVF